MKNIYFFIVALSLMVASGICFADGFKDSAISWQKQAKDTRVKVVAVAEELGSLTDQGNQDAKGLIEDATKWLEEGDTFLKKGDEEFEAQDYEKSSYSYNMAWQYYVKAATAGLNAKRILTGQ